MMPKKDLVEILVNKVCLIILLFFVSSCSLDTKSGIWTQEKKIEEVNQKISKIFNKEKNFDKELNSGLKIKLELTNNLNQNSFNLKNNSGILDLKYDIKKFSKFKFSKIDNFNYFEPEIVFDGKNFIFFDDKSNLIKFDNDFKIVWKKNFYSKQEKKLKPILTLGINKNYLVVIDNIGKIYTIDIFTGNLIWAKTNINPFNSQVKISNDKIYAIDMNNILRCFSLKNGKEIWKYNSENTFLKSNKRNSLVVDKNIIYFNNSLGDVTAVNADNGRLLWQLPTQSSDIYENAFGLMMSDLVIESDNLIFSNNRSELYSINKNNGILNWKQNINSDVRSVILKNLIISFSNEGYLFIIDKKTGNIIRVTDVFNVFKIKKRKKIKPVGFILGKEKIMLSTNNGRLLIIDIQNGKTEKILKIDNNKVSRPFVFKKSIILVKNNSVIRLN